MSWVGNLRIEREQAKAKLLELKLLRRQSEQNRNKLRNRVSKLESRIAKHKRRHHDLLSDLGSALVLEDSLAVRLHSVEKNLSLYAPRLQPEATS